MYGPPADSRQQLAPVEVFDTPEAYITCCIVGLILSVVAWRTHRLSLGLRAALFIFGQTVLLTAPLAVFLDTFVYGSFPTVDKAASIAFFVEGAHWRIMQHPVDAIHDPAAILMGVDVGHLWVGELLHTFLTPLGAFNAQALLYPALSWWCAWLLFHELKVQPRVALLMAFPFGMGLHVFRDLNWYTVEKSALFWIPLLLTGLLRWKCGRAHWWIAPVLFASAWTGLYLGLINFGLVLLGCGAMSWTHPRRIRSSIRLVCVCFLTLMPLVSWQWMVAENGVPSSLDHGSIWHRETLDSVTLFPFRWDRLEWHRALNVIAFGIGLYGMHRQRKLAIVRFIGVVGLVYFSLSLGPHIGGFELDNPLFLAARETIPGFWRIGNPEVFFHVTWLSLLAVGAIQIQAWDWSRRTTGFMYGVFIVGWLLMVRTHPAYPPMTMPQADEATARPVQSPHTKPRGFFWAD